MADTKISAFTAGAPALSTDEVVVARSSANRRLTLDQVLALQTRRNLVINGAMEVDQRNAGAAQALTTSATYALDRWAGMQYTAAASTIQRSLSGGGLAAPRYCLVLKRNNGSSGTGAIVAVQVFETSDSWRFAGKTVTLSFWAVAGASFSAAGSQMGVVFSYGTGTDQSAVTYTAGGFTGQVNLHNALQTITAAWVRYSVTVAIPAGATQLAIEFYFEPTGTAGALDYLAVTGVQIEEGSTASPFEFRPYAQELALCQRYCEVIDTNTTTIGLPAFLVTGNTARTAFAFHVEKRSNPSATITPANVNINHTGGNVAPSSASVYAGTWGGCVDFVTGTSPFTAGHAASVGITNRGVIFNAEL